MKLRVWIPALAVSLTVAGLAQAQPIERERRAAMPPGTIPAPSNALELSIATGYTQGFGSLRGDVGLPSVATPGIGVDVSIGYRFNPRLAILVAGQYQELKAERADAARGVTGTLAAQYHFSPTRQVDPWAEVGFGYRWLWEVPSTGPRLLTHGFQLVRARVGVDFRASPAVALGPVVGADATAFLFQDIPGLEKNISDPKVSTFVFAGVQGRFDMGGQAGLPAPPTTQELETISAR